MKFTLRPWESRIYITRLDFLLDPVYINPMSDPAKKNKNFSYRDYLTWPEDERWELIHGEAFAISPAPAFRHQKIVGSVFNQIYNQLKDKKCQPMVEPLDVRLTEKLEKNKEKIHVVQPDVLVFCDPEKADDKGIVGAPDWILEVLSDSTAWKDTTIKLELYQQFGVREYWILNPETQLLLVYVLKEGKFGLPTPYLGSVTVPVTIFPGVVIEI